MISKTENAAAQIQAKLLEAVALHKAGELSKAQEVYRHVLKLQPGQFDALHLLGVIAAQKRDFTQSVALIDKALRTNPHNATAHYNRAIALDELRQFTAAIASYDKAIQLAPDHAVAYNNRGVAFSALKQHQAAIASYDMAIQLQPTYAEAYNNRGNARNDLLQHEAAAADFAKALALKPDYAFVLGTMLHTRMRICDWSGLERSVADLAGKLERGEAPSPPLPVVGLIDSLSLQRKTAEAWVMDKCPPRDDLGAIPKRGRRRKIRLGYFSMDFRVHPVADLIAHLIEAHDRDRFEIYGFSFGPDTQDEMRKRLERAFDTFVDVAGRSDRDIAETARRMGVDIAIDLAGHTTDSRTGIFALRAAPIQVNYLGYPGTMGAAYMDYIIGDRTIIADGAGPHYGEKIVRLPHAYICGDSKRIISEAPFSRQSLGLPDSGFVFCCFNNSFKITPETFDAWMRILHRVDKSVLWLSEHNQSSRDNLLKEAEHRGIARSRLIFAERLPAKEDHLARHRAADLFLDTLPFNAHTTAVDALWAGLPVLTRAGQSFAGRVAASLLSVLELPELIATTPEDFESLAVALATDPARLEAIRQKLMDNRLRAPLFDAAAFARGIENAYTRMYERYQAELPPDDIQVAASANAEAG